MTIAIVGSSGEIGARLTQYLLEAGRNPRAISRRLSPRLARWGKLDFRAVDLSDVASLADALKGCDTVFNCAVDKSGTGDPVRSNVEICRSIIEAAEASKVRRFIHLSSFIVAPLPMTANVLRHPYTYSEESDWYTRAKVETEKLVLSARSRMEVSVVRPGVVYGPFLNWSRAAFGVAADQVRVLPTGVSRCYAVSVDDLVGLLIHLADQAERPPRLLWAVHPEQVSWQRFFEAHAQYVANGSPRTVLVEADVIERRNAPSGLLRDTARWLWHSPLLRRIPVFSDAARVVVDLLRRFRRMPSPDPLAAPEMEMHWPDPEMLKIFRCEAQFTPEEIGETNGYHYEQSLEAGVLAAAAWWRWSPEGTTE